MTVILHIGVHKTGTSALQSFLHRNAALLSKRGIFYKPTIAEWPNHNPLAMAFMPSVTDSGPNHLAKALREAKDRTLLISSEMLCEPAVDINLFLSCLKGHDVRTIAYVRHPCDIVISAFNQVVRHHEAHWTRNLNDRPFAYDPTQMDVLQRWLDATSVTLAPYDKQQWAGGSIFSDFLDMIGIADNNFDCTQIGENESIPHPLAETLRLVNMTNPSAEQHRAIVEHLRTIECKPGPYPLTPDNVKMCIAHMREALPSYRPHFRRGFREDFLLDARPALPKSHTMTSIDTPLS